MSNNPRITIGITCFNAEDTIARALDSALAQDYANTEILVVDDGSSDGSIVIVEGYAQRHSNVQLIRHKKNKGTASTRNTILDNFTGEYLAFFDDDDKSTPERVRMQHERIVKSGTPLDSIFCFCNREVVKKGESVVSEEKKGIGYAAPEPQGKEVALFILLEELAALKNEAAPQFTWGCCGSGIMLAHRSAFEKIGEFTTKFSRCEDWDFMIRASFSGARFVSVNQTLMRQYLTGGSDKAKKSVEQAKLGLVLNYQEYLRERNSFLIALCMTHPFFKPIKSIAKRLRAWRKKRKPA